MIHIITEYSSCIIYKKSDCEKYLADLICARAPAIPLNHQDATISAATDTRNVSGVSIIYRNCSGKNLGSLPTCKCPEMS